MAVLYKLKVHHLLGYFFLYKTPLKHKNDNMTISVNIITTLHSYILQWLFMTCD